MLGRRSRRARAPISKPTSGSAPAATFDGFDGLDATSYYVSSGQGIIGAQAGFHVQCWVWIESQAVSSLNRVFLANVPTSTSGWRFLTTTTNATLNFGCFDSTGSVNRVSPALTITAGHIGRPLHVCGAISGGTIKLWVDGVSQGAGTAITAYAPPASLNMSIGRRMLDTLSANGDIRVIGGVAGGHYAPSDAEVLAAYSAGLASGNIAHIVGGTSEMVWSFKSLGSAVASIPATTGAETLNKNGAPTFLTGL